MKRSSRLVATGLAATGVVATAGVAAGLGVPQAAPKASTLAHTQVTSAVVADLERQLSALQGETVVLRHEAQTAAKALLSAAHAQQVARERAAQRAAAAEAAAQAVAAQRAAQQSTKSYSSSRSSAPTSHGSTGASGSSNGEGGNDD